MDEAQGEITQAFRDRLKVKFADDWQRHQLQLETAPVHSGREVVPPKREPPPNHEVMIRKQRLSQFRALHVTVTSLLKTYAEEKFFVDASSKTPSLLIQANENEYCWYLDYPQRHENLKEAAVWYQHHGFFVTLCFAGSGSQALGFNASWIHQNTQPECGLSETELEALILSKDKFIPSLIRHQF